MDPAASASPENMLETQTQPQNYWSTVMGVGPAISAVTSPPHDPLSPWTLRVEGHWSCSQCVTVGWEKSSISSKRDISRTWRELTVLVKYSVWGCPLPDGQGFPKVILLP